MSFDIIAPPSSKALGPYSPAIVSGGTVYCSGQIGVAGAGGSDVATETRQALANLEEVLVSAGSSLLHVLKTTVYLTDLRNFEVMNAVYAEAFGGHRPARVTVEVSALPAGALVEIDAIAAVA